MIPYSHKEINQLKIRNQMQRSHSKKGTQCISLKIKKVFLRLVMGLSAKGFHYYATPWVKGDFSCIS
ncbi:hypothetical protein H5410_030461 [Solanum commersonii]|uniref:Uncharacterized protein n=1 Tax=Solanum commersonii TaxID=4109 RepID=A0A9J5YEC8_SOLCO|nr:hypothetical protein H5410_030461 [Solanum commersonii]